MTEKITIKPNYNFNSYILPLKHKVTKSWSTYVIILIAFLMLIFNITYYFDKSIYQNNIPTFNIILPLLVFIIFPLSFYFGLKRSFAKNDLIKQDISITYNKEGIIEKGETYRLFTEWNKIKSVKEYKKYFIMKNINGQDLFFPKSFFDSKKLISFKQLIKNIGY